MLAPSGPGPPAGLQGLRPRQRLAELHDLGRQVPNGYHFSHQERSGCHHDHQARNGYDEFGHLCCQAHNLCDALCIRDSVKSSLKNQAFYFRWTRKRCYLCC